MGRLFLEYLDCKAMYACKKCLTHLANRETLISKVSLNLIIRHFVIIQFRVFTAKPVRHICLSCKYYN